MRETGWLIWLHQIDLATAAATFLSHRCLKNQIDYYGLRRCLRNNSWSGRLGLNQRPTGYEPAALTAELRPEREHYITAQMIY